MKNEDPLLRVQFDGLAVGPGRIPVSHLIRFLDCFNKVLKRTGHVLASDADSVHYGRRPSEIAEDVALDLVQLTHGSPSVVLGLERRQTELAVPGIDLGDEILERAIGGLGAVQTADGSLPQGYDRGVLMAWRDAGALFRQEVDRIEFSLNHRKTPAKAAFTGTGLARIQDRIEGPHYNIRTIEGRLMMADFKEHGTRCRVHPSVGTPILCLFDQDQKDEVLEDILRYVRVVGEAQEDPVSGRVASIKIHNIERLEDRENEDTDLLPKGTPVSQDFWESPTLDDLAQSQQVQPIADVRTLFGTWPGDDDDGFEVSVRDLRNTPTMQEDV